MAHTRPKTLQILQRTGLWRLALPSALAAATIFVGGCAPDSIDASTKASVEKSIDTLVKKASEKEKPRLEAARKAYRAAYASSSAPPEAALPSWRAVDGMNSEQFLHYSEQFLEPRTHKEQPAGPRMYVTAPYLATLKLEKSTLEARRQAVYNAGMYTHDQFPVQGLGIEPVQVRASGAKGVAIRVKLTNEGPYNVFAPQFRVAVTMDGPDSPLVERLFKEVNRAVIQPGLSHVYELECCSCKDNPSAYKVAR